MRSPTNGTSRLVNSVEPAESVRHNNLVYELQATGRDIITLSLGEAFFDIPVPRFAEPGPAGLHHYSHSRGLPELRARLAKYYRNHLRTPVDPDREILVTAGSKAAIYLALLATVDPGDEVVIPEPYWLSYPEQVRLCGGVPVPVPHDAGIADLDRYIGPRTRAIIINNPNNPSGRAYSAAELRQLHELADRHGIYLLADEAYNEFVLDSDEFIPCGSLDPEKQHTITVNSLSKNYGISGWRIGYTIAAAPLVDQILKLNQHLITCAPTILSWYLAEHFDDLIEVTRPQIERVVRLRNRAAGWLAERGIGALPGTATFYLFASLGDSALNSVEFAGRLLRERSVSVVPGLAYGPSCDRHIRISVGTEPEDRLIRGIDAIEQLIAETSP